MKQGPSTQKETHFTLFALLPLLLAIGSLLPSPDGHNFLPASRQETSPTSTPSSAAWEINDSNPNFPGAENSFGIKLLVDHAIPLGDYTYLLGHTQWEDHRISMAYLAGWNVKAYDSQGREMAFEPANWEAIGLTPQPGHWLYRLYGNAFNSPLTIQATHMVVDFNQPLEFQLDPRTAGFNGSDAKLDTVWQIDPIRLDAYGLRADLVQIRFMQQGELQGFELGFESDPMLQALPFSLQSAVSGGRGASGGGSNRNPSAGLIFTYVLSDGEMSLPLLLRTNSLTLNGAWQTTWTPADLDPASTPILVQQPLLSLEDWLAALETHANMPAELAQDKILLRRSSLSSGNPLNITDLAGSEERCLAMDNGSLSPDGSKLLYLDSGANAAVMDIENNEIVQLTHGMDSRQPFWSADGQQIAFQSTSDGQSIFLMNANGENFHTVLADSDDLYLWGWKPDEDQILLSQTDGNRNSTLQLFNVNNGDTQLLFSVASDAPMPAFSPDGNWLAYLDRVPGRMANGLYIAQVDGSQKQLIVQLDYWPVANAGWSPDGKWIAFSAINTDLFVPTSTNGLINVESGQVIPLPQLEGVILSWIHP